MELENYYKQVLDYTRNSILSKEDTIIDVAQFMAEIMQNDGVIQLFGVDHDIALGMELGFRAGGLIQYHIMDLQDLLLRNEVTKEETLREDYYSMDGLVDKLFDTYDIRDTDGFVFYASNVVEDIVLEAAKKAKKNGHKVILLTNKEIILNNSKDNAEDILALADKVIDFEIEDPDLFFEVGDLRVGQVTNVISTMVAQTLTMEIYKYLKNKGETPGTLWSMNIKGADEHNFALTSKFDGRWNS